jgi:hypothetical protein
MLSRGASLRGIPENLGFPASYIKSISYIGLWIYTTKLRPLSPKKWGYMIDIKGITRCPR